MHTMQQEQLDDKCMRRSRTAFSQFANVDGIYQFTDIIQND